MLVFVCRAKLYALVVGLCMRANVISGHTNCMRGCNAFGFAVQKLTVNLDNTHARAR